MRDTDQSAVLRIALEIVRQVEIVGEPGAHDFVDDHAVEIAAAQHIDALMRDDGDFAVDRLRQRDIERAAAEIVNQKLAGTFRAFHRGQARRQ